MSNAEKPVYPIVDNEGSPQNYDWDKIKDRGIGLTKREYFAAMAMQGMIMMAEPMSDIDMVIKKSIQCADELLNQLDK